MRNRPYYITTAITYPNAQPHMGHALEWLQADVLARYNRLFAGVPVRFQIGLDEFGLKNQRAAAAARVETAQFIESQQGSYRSLVERLGISCDRFIRTSESDHIQLAQAFWNRCLVKGDIYKKQYRAWYNVKEEEFLGMADEVTDPSVFGLDPKFLELIDEENYFFAASKYQNEVIRILETDQYAVVPANRKLELLNFVKDKGLQDISVSREKSKLQWGIPVPGDDTQVMYVWFDALTNYITGASSVVNGEIELNEFWPAALHSVGKDISRFHGLLWPAMLLSAELPLPEKLLTHGFVLSNGRKMSKSIGNVVDPVDVLNDFGTDPLRWYLIHAIPTQDDGDFTLERLNQVYSSDLANDYGNLVSRVVSMVHKYCGGLVPAVTPEQVDNVEKVLLEEKWQEYHAAFTRLELQEATAAAHAIMVFCNRRIEELKPWVLAKDEHKRPELEECLYELLEGIRQATLMLQPIIPETTQRVAREVFPHLAASAWTAEGTAWGLLESGSALGPSLALFPRRET